MSRAPVLGDLLRFGAVREVLGGILNEKRTVDKGVIFMKFDREVLRIDPHEEAARICEFITSQVLLRFKRKGVVVCLSATTGELRD